MTAITLEFIGEQIAKVLDEQRAQRLELRRLNENQMQMAQSIGSLRNDMNSMRNDMNLMRNDLELMIKTEIGGLFAHLETRLERYIDDALRERS